MDRFSCDCGAKNRAVTGCATEKRGSEDLNPQLYVTFNAVALILPVICFTIFGVGDRRITLGSTGGVTLKVSYWLPALQILALV
jgi:hypothetical protein